MMTLTTPASATPAWAIPEHLAVGADGVLEIDGTSAARLVAEHGSPLYVFSERRILSNVRRLQSAAARIPNPLKFCYAAKANSNMGVLAAVLRARVDLEVNSGGELFKALRVGFRPEQIVFNGTSKTSEELDAAITAGIYAINVDSIYELDLIEAAARRANRPARVALRLVPDLGTRTHAGLQTALLTSKFGITASGIEAAFDRVLRSRDLIELCGIHIHVGSQTPDAAPYAHSLRLISGHAARLLERTGRRLDHINLGGGLPVNYLRDASHAEDLPEAERLMFAADLEPAEVIAHALESLVDEADLPEDITLVFEPGRSVVGDAGLMLTTIRNIKHRPETNDTWLLTDAGYNLLLSMNNYKWYYHLLSATRAGEPHRTPYKLAGPLCDGGDVYFDIEGGRRLPEHRLLPPEAAPGELLALLNCGAYSLAQAFPYNGRRLPAAVMLREDGAVDVVRRADTYDDLIRNDVW